MLTTERHSVLSVSSDNPEPSRTDTHFTGEETEPVASSSSKNDDIPLSESSEEAENMATQTLDNLVEQLPKSPSIIDKKNRKSTANGLKSDHEGANGAKDDKKEKQQAETETDSDPNIQNEFGVCGWILTILSYILIFFTLPISVCMCIKVVQEYERAVIFRLGRLMPGGAKGPGIFFIVPCIDTYRKVDLRVISFEVPPQEILSKDSVTVAVDAVVYFRISNATISVTNVEDAARSTKLLAQTTLRNILGTKTLAEMLSDREAISLQMQITLDEATEPWGVKVERVEVKDVRLPIQLQRAMAAEAEAAREARAKVIVAEGEQKASRALKEAAEVIAESPSALQLRYLQTLNSISAEKNSTIIFPFPIDLLSSFFHRTAPKVVEAPIPPRRIRPCCLYKYPEWVQGMFPDSDSLSAGVSHRHSTPRNSSTPSTTSTRGRSPYHHLSPFEVSPGSETSSVSQAAAVAEAKLSRPKPDETTAAATTDSGTRTRRHIQASNRRRSDSSSSLLKQAIVNRMHADAAKQRSVTLVSNSRVQRSTSLQPAISSSRAAATRTRAERSGFLNDGHRNVGFAATTGSCSSKTSGHSQESMDGWTKEIKNSSMTKTPDTMDKSAVSGSRDAALRNLRILNETAKSSSWDTAEAASRVPCFSTTKPSPAFTSVSEDDTTDNGATNHIFKSALVQGKGAGGGGGGGAESSLSESSSRHSHKSVTFSDRVIVNEIEGRTRRLHFRGLAAAAVGGADEESSDDERENVTSTGSTPPRRQLRSKRSFWNTDDEYFERVEEEQEPIMDETEGSDGWYQEVYETEESSCSSPSTSPSDEDLVLDEITVRAFYNALYGSCGDARRDSSELSVEDSDDQAEVGLGDFIRESEGVSGNIPNEREFASPVTNDNMNFSTNDCEFLNRNGGADGRNNFMFEQADRLGIPAVSGSRNSQSFPFANGNPPNPPAVFALNGIHHQLQHHHHLLHQHHQQQQYPYLPEAPLGRIDSDGEEYPADPGPSASSESLESIVSRESVVSAASIKAEHLVRRNFDY